MCYIGTSALCRRWPELSASMSIAWPPLDPEQNVEKIRYEQVVGCVVGRFGFPDETAGVSPDA